MHGFHEIDENSATITEKNPTKNKNKNIFFKLCNFPPNSAHLYATQNCKIPTCVVQFCDILEITDIS